MAFKPLTKNPPSTKEGELSTKTKEQEEFDKLMNSTKLPDIVKTTEERIYIIFDDSWSMNAQVPNSVPAGTQLTKSYQSSTCYDPDKTRLTLAHEATIEYMRNCKPRVTAIEIAPLNQEPIPMTKNLPSVASQIKTLTANGGTPLYEAMGKLVDSHKEAQFTRALIFTDGQAGGYDYYSYNRPTLFKEIKDLGIPVDLIIIGDVTEAALDEEQRELKNFIESTEGTFLICKDGNAFKEKMKYFAPLLRHMLPAIASKES